MNFNTSLNDRNKKIVFAAGAIVLCLAVASAVYVGLKMLTPESNSYSSEGRSEQGEGDLTVEEQISKDADAAFKAGEDAFITGNSEEAIAKLNEAKRLYEQANDIMKAEQTTDYISFVTQETSVEEEQQQREASPNDTKATSLP